MRIDENFIMRIQRSMFTIIMIFLIVFGIGSIVSSGMLKAGDNDLAEALAKNESDSSSVVMNSDTQKTTVNKKEVKTKTTVKKEQSTTAPEQNGESGQDEQGGSSERLSVSEIQPPAAISQAQVQNQNQAQTEQQTSFVLEVGSPPAVTWSAIKISATKPTVPATTAKVTKPTEATNPTTEPTTVPVTEEEEELSTEPDTMPTEIIVTIPTDPSTEATSEPPTETVEPPTQAPTETTGEPGTEQTTDSTGTEATTVDPLTSSEPPTAYPDATSATGPPLTTMPEQMQHSGDSNFGANYGGHITNTADLSHRANNDISSTLLIVSVVLALVAIMLLGVYFHITKDKKKKHRKNGW